MNKEDVVEVGTGKISSTGSVVIPSHIRDREGLKAGDRVSIVDIDGKIFIQKPDPEKVRRAIREIEKAGK